MPVMNISSLITDDEQRLLKRCEELFSRAENGAPVTTQFLNLRERYIIEHQLSYMFSADDSAPLCFFFGGFPGAQRTLLCFLPSYYRYSLPDNSSPEHILRDELSDAIVPLRIISSGYVKLSHRDYLGSLIGLGLDRSALGDILTDDGGAVIFVLPTVSDVIKNELVHIGRDKVRVCDAGLPDDFNYEPSFENVRGTVASARLDAVLAELICASRESAKTVIRQGLVEHNHFTASEPDVQVADGDIISAKKTSGCKGGKFIIDSLDERSAKGRIRLAARRYI